MAGTYEGASGGSAGTATLSWECPNYSIWTVEYYDPATGEKQTKHLNSDEPDVTITVPCNVGITMSMNVRDYFDPFSAGIRIWGPASSPEDDAPQLPFEEHRISYCPKCDDRYDQSHDHWYDNIDNFDGESGEEPIDGSPTHYVVSFCIPKTYANKRITVCY